MRILLTGSTGLLGSHIVYQLLQSEHTVRCLIRKEPPGGWSESMRRRVEWHTGDILDVYSLQDALAGMDAVIHAAGLVSFDPKQREHLYQVNAEGTANLVNMCLDQKVSRIVHVSSVAALGRTRDGQTIDESAEWQDGKANSQYAISKHLGELEIFRGIAEGLSAVMVNPTIILGPAADWTKGSVAMVDRIHQGFSWYTRGINGFVDVRDVAHVICRLVDSTISGERFIVNADNWSYKQVFETIAQELGVRAPFKCAQAWQSSLVWRMESLKAMLGGGSPLVTRETAQTAQIKVYYNNLKLLHALPGFSYRSLSSTLEDTCRFYKKHESGLEALWSFLGAHQESGRS